MIFSLKGAVKLRELCNIAYSGASADKPSSAQVKRTLRCFTGNGEKLIKTTSTSHFTLVFAKFCQLYLDTANDNDVIIQTVLGRNCLYERHRCRWPYLHKVGKIWQTLK